MRMRGVRVIREQKIQKVRRTVTVRGRFPMDRVMSVLMLMLMLMVNMLNRVVHHGQKHDDQQGIGLEWIVQRHPVQVTVARPQLAE